MLRVDVPDLNRQITKPPPDPCRFGRGARIGREAQSRIAAAIGIRFRRLEAERMPVEAMERCLVAHAEQHRDARSVALSTRYEHDRVAVGVAERAPLASCLAGDPQLAVADRAAADRGRGSASAPIRSCRDGTAADGRRATASLRTEARRPAARKRASVRARWSAGRRRRAAWRASQQGRERPVTPIGSLMSDRSPPFPSPGALRSAHRPRRAGERGRPPSRSVIARRIRRSPAEVEALRADEHDGEPECEPKSTRRTARAAAGFLRPGFAALPP
jgi:hypothetical protein